MKLRAMMRAMMRRVTRRMETMGTMGTKSLEGSVNDPSSLAYRRKRWLRGKLRRLLRVVIWMSLRGNVVDRGTSFPLLLLRLQSSLLWHPYPKANHLMHKTRPCSRPKNSGYKCTNSNSNNNRNHNNTSSPSLPSSPSSTPHLRCPHLVRQDIMNIQKLC